MSLERTLRSFAILGRWICAVSPFLWGSPAISGPTVAFEPVPLCGGLPDTVVTFEASIWVDASGDSLGCYHLLMTYDRSYLQLERAAEGELFRHAAPPYLFIHEYPELDTTAFTCCLLGNRTYVMGPGETVKLQFRVLECPPGNRTTLDLVTRRVSPPPEDFAFFADIDRNLIPGVTHTDGIAWLCGECASSADEADGFARASLEASPNPAGRLLSLAWTVPTDARDARMEIFAADGRRVLERRIGAPSGSVEWDLNDPSGAAVPSGAYFVRLRAGGETILRKIVRVQ